MLTFPTANAIRGNHPTTAHRAEQRDRAERLVPAQSEAARAGARVGIVVHLELPERGPVVSGADQSDLDALAASGAPDLHRLARAVQDLVRAAAPTVITRVSIEPALGDAGPGEQSQSGQPAAMGQPEAGPRLRPVPSRAEVVRTGSTIPAAGHVAPPAPFDVVDDDIDIDLVGRTLRVDGRPVELTRREFDLLAYLHGRRAVALSRRELMNAVWQTGYLAGDRTIDVHVRRVRAKLGRHADRLTTLRGFGYRFD